LRIEHPDEYHVAIEITGQQRDAVRRATTIERNEIRTIQVAGMLPQPPPPNGRYARAFR
jgi:hypothetical protein